MNIALIGRDYYPAVGGMEQHLRELARGLHNRGHSVTVVNLRTTPDMALPEEPFVQIQEFAPMTKNPLSIVRYYHRLTCILNELLRKQKLDIVHWHDLIAGVPIRFWRPRTKATKIFTNHSSGFLKYRSHILVRPYFRYSLGHADGVIGPSLELTELSQKSFRNISNIEFIANGVDTERFTPGNSEPVREEFSLSKSDIVVLCPRRLSPKNGVSFLAKAIPLIVEKNKNVRFLITGKGEPREEEVLIKKIVSESNSEPYVRFIGNIPNEKMPDIYRSADIVIFPSLMEAVSISALEAMSCAKAVVASSVGGLYDLMHGRDIGLLVPPKDPSAIAREVTILVENESKRKTLGTNARKFVCENYSWASISKKTEEFYIKVCNWKSTHV